MHSRRVTVTHGGEATAAIPDPKLTVVEVSAEMREVVASVLEELNTEPRFAPAESSAQLSRRRRLRVWFRRCF
jgi:hypothetical protein